MCKLFEIVLFIAQDVWWRVSVLFLLSFLLFFVLLLFVKLCLYEYVCFFPSSFVCFCLFDLSFFSSICFVLFCFCFCLFVCFVFLSGTVVFKMLFM